jgi:acetyl esterase/lipase
MVRNCFASKHCFILAAIGSLFSLGAYSQAKWVNGITSQPDTSYTTWSAFNSTRKSHPDIKIVPELQSKKIAGRKNIPYCTINDRDLRLDIFVPATKAKKKRTAIVIIHGGGWRSGNRTQHYPLAQHLAERGYVCFTPEYRLSTEAQYPAAIHDLKAALRWIVQHADEYRVDTTNISVLGFSAGGQLAAFLGTTVGNPQFEGTACNAQLPAAPVHAVTAKAMTVKRSLPEPIGLDIRKKTVLHYGKKLRPSTMPRLIPRLTCLSTAVLPVCMPAVRTLLKY